LREKRTIIIQMNTSNYNTETVKDELRKLYTETFQKCDVSGLPKDLAPKDLPTKALLVDPSKKYLGAKLRIAYYGQETNGWGGVYAGSDDLDLCLKSYHNFVNIADGEDFNNYPGQFWNAVRSFQRSFLDLEQNSGFYWNNIIKAGRAEGEGRPTESVMNWQRDWIANNAAELSILSPQIVIFFTGPNYDDMIKQSFADVQYKKFDGFVTRELSLLQAPNLPYLTFRTYHPGYLYRYDFEGIKGAIFTHVKKHLGI
jgi:hypothetical protein